MMDSQQLSLLSSLKEELKPEDYIQPHYKEAYRLAIDSLVNEGRESYQEFLKAERIGSFLSEDELHFITTNASQPLPSNHTEEINGPAPDTPASKSSTGTYWPVHSDIATPDLELGWPEVTHDRLQTNIDLLFHPPRLNSPTIKEVIRKQIQDARQVIAIVMDIFTDVDIFKEVVDASTRGIPVYVLLDEFHLQSFLLMVENQDIQIPKLRNMKVRTVKGQDYLCRSGATFHGAMEQKFLLVDCQTVVYGSYSFMWSYEKINLSMVQVITGQLVESYDEEFRTLFARSFVLAVLIPPETVLLERNGRHAQAKYASESRQAFERKDQLRHTLDTVYRKACERQTGMTSPIREMEERLYDKAPFERRPMINHGESVQNRVHQFQSAETVNFLKRHSYAGERQEVLYVPHNTRCDPPQHLAATISVSVSVLTLSCIALDRWYAICHPLMFKSTARRARKSIILIWLVSCVIMIPQAIVMECSSLLPELTNKTSLFTVCDEHWGADVYPRVYHTCFFIATYLAPLCLMVLAYTQICHKLWCQQIPGTSSVLQRKRTSLQCSAYPPGPGESARVRTSTVSAEIKQVRARRKTARMLMVVLFVFALCYLPISVLNIMKRVFGTFKYTNSRETVYAWFTFSHWLIYANSAANPIIYNFLSGKFRAEFKAAFSCHSFGRCQNQTAGIRKIINTDSRKSLSTQVNNMDNVSRISDHVV
ncbi:hypothetical protein J4Q44_G00275910 [Coregonus suidteri]|uniref:Orexin receptor type 2 n=1 Tax=Coregonus suidteri TaxID=861788 RepID=A0AAN8L169_9TELE